MNQLTETEIEALCQRYPLPDGVEDCVMTREELADAMAVSMPTVSDWLRKGMPMLVEGDKGRAYELQLSACWAWRQAQRAEEDLRAEKVRRAQQAMRLQLVGGRSGDTMEALEPKVRREIISVQIEQERFQRERNQLIRREDVRDALEIVFGLIRDRMNAAPDVIERRMALEPKAIDELIGICDDLVADVRSEIENFWRNRPVRDAQKSDLFDA